LLKLFYRFDLCHETTYDLLINFYGDMGFIAREKYWIQEQITRIYNREKMEPNATTTDVCIMLHAMPQASRSDLPQIRILEQILATFQKCPGFEKAFVRGSLARGNADLYSDIDLLCEVSPQDFGSFIDQADSGIKNHHNAVADGLVDAVVKDFGGIGYIYLLEASGRIYQLDLYVTCQGRPWGSQTYRREIFRRIHKENDMEKHESLLYRLHGVKVDHQIQRLQNVEPSVGQTLVELNVLGVMLKKCLERGDNFVASSEYNMWRTCFVKMIR
jgi:predicted nucleotidyltransferase